MTGITVVLVVLLLATAVGFWLRHRDGQVRSSRVTDHSIDTPRTRELVAAGVPEGSVTVLHFSASWCRPCGTVRRVVASVVAEANTTLTPTADIEVDLDENPDLARTMGVLSLPTTFVLDPDLVERFRVSGVPSAPDLTAAIMSARTGR